MLTTKQKDLLQQVIVGGIGGAAGRMLLKYDMKTSIVIGAVAYLAYSSVFNKKSSLIVSGGLPPIVPLHSKLHRNQ